MKRIYQLQLLIKTSIVKPGVDESCLLFLRIISFLQKIFPLMYAFNFYALNQKRRWFVDRPSWSWSLWGYFCPWYILASALPRHSSTKQTYLKLFSFSFFYYTLQISPQNFSSLHQCCGSGSVWIRFILVSRIQVAKDQPKSWKISKKFNQNHALGYHTFFSKILNVWLIN